MFIITTDAQGRKFILNLDSVATITPSFESADRCWVNFRDQSESIELNEHISTIANRLLRNES
jgi:hypothetical protein